MSWRALTVGLLCGCGIGLGIGWLAFGTQGDPEPIEVLPLPSAATPAASPTLQGTPDASPPPPAEPKPEVVDLGQVIREGTGQEVGLAARQTEPPFADGVVEAATARLPEARSAGDWRLFKALLELLGRADTPEADQALVAVMGDEALVFPGPVGSEFHGWLEGSEVPGIVDAARRRLKQNTADGDTSWVGTHGWVDLVAAHGTREDIAWLLLESDTRDMQDDGAVAVAKSKNPAAIEWMREFLVLPHEERGARAGWGSYSRALREFVRAHGEEAFDVVAEIVDRELAGESVITNLKVDQLLGMYGGTVPRNRAPEAVRLLQGLPTEAARIQGVKAVLAMQRRGIDVTGLEPLLDAPLEALRRMAGGEEKAGDGSASAYTALYAIEYNPALWSEEAAEALEAAGQALMGETSAAANMIEVAKEVRAGLRSPWRKE